MKKSLLMFLVSSMCFTFSLSAMEKGEEDAANTPSRVIQRPDAKMVKEAVLSSDSFDNFTKKMMEYGGLEQICSHHEIHLSDWELFRKAIKSNPLTILPPDFAKLSFLSVDHDLGELSITLILRN